MFNYSRDGVTIATILDERRMKANGKFPAKIRVGFHRKQTYYQTGKDFTAEEWQRLPTAKQRGSVRDREDLQTSFETVREAVRDLLDNGAFTFRLLNNRMKVAGIITINELMRLRIDELRNAERIGSMRRYINALRALENYAGDKIPLSDITPEWLKIYEDKRKAEGKKQSTIAIVLNALKTTLNIAARQGLIKKANLPFGRDKFIVRDSESRKLALSLEQIGELARYNGSETLCKYRDLWLFMFFCNGINISDLARLKYSDISDGEIHFIRRKTKNSVSKHKYIRVHITQPMQNIMNKWGNPYRPSGYIFPILEGNETEYQIFTKISHYTRNINRHTNILGEILGLGPITTYTARHSFATVLQRSGVNVSYISESLGHTNVKITEAYLGGFEREEREKNARLLLNF